MAHYLDPRNDLAFKRVFGEHKNLCISLLNSMLPLDETQQIVSIEYQTGELLPQIGVLRNSIVDVRCTDTKGRQFLVEMQMYWTESFKKRVLLNASKAYIMQLDKAEEYKFLQPVYALNFVNETFEKSPGMQHEYYHHYKIVNVNHTEIQIEGLEFIFIELTKFTPQNKGEKKLRELWLRFLTEINERTEKIPDELLANNDTREAINYMEIGAYSKGQLLTYDDIRGSIMTERSNLSEAEEKGRSEGKIEGKIEGKAEMIRNSYKAGIPVETIAIISGFTEEEVRAILKE